MRKTTPAQDTATAKRILLTGDRSKIFSRTFDNTLENGNGDAVVLNIMGFCLRELQPLPLGNYSFAIGTPQHAIWLAHQEQAKLIKVLKEVGMWEPWLSFNNKYAERVTKAHTFLNQLQLGA